MCTFFVRNCVPAMMLRKFPVWVATHAEVTVPILVLVVMLAALVAVQGVEAGED